LDEKRKHDALILAIGIGWLTCISLPIAIGIVPALATLTVGSLCRCATANAPANGTCRVSVLPNAHSLGR